MGAVARGMRALMWIASQIARSSRNIDTHVEQCINYLSFCELLNRKSVSWR
jgi:hypothetical protein